MKIQIDGYFSPGFPEATVLSLEAKLPPVVAVAFRGPHKLPTGQIADLDVELTDFEFPGIFRLKEARVIDAETIIAAAKNTMWIPGGNL